MDHKTFPFKITNLDFTGRTLEGYANVFSIKDDVGDIVWPGSFNKTLIERGNKIKFLWQHDTMEPIGRPLELHEDDNGLFIKAIISDTTRGRDALALLRDGAIGEMSIGYETVKNGFDYTKDPMSGDTVRNLREVKLYEVSLVTFPANESAVVTALKESGPTEKKPWNVFMDGDQHCVYKVDENGDRTGESLGCHPTAEEARQQVEALYANEGKADDKQVTRSEADGNHPASHYLVVEDPEKPSTWHLRVRDVNGDPDHRLMGAAWAALHGGYRGNVYEGPGKQEAIRKLRAMYAAEEMDTPKDDGKAGRRVRADKVELIHQLEDVLGKLKSWAEYDDEEDAAPKGADETPETKQAGPGTAPLTSQEAEPEVTPPTSEELLRLIEIEEDELSLMR